MNVLEAIRKAQEDGVCIRRADWPEDQLRRNFGRLGGSLK